MTNPFWSSETQDRVIDMCDRLENLGDARELAKVMEVANPKPLDMGGE
jgi:hypothetical protein